MSGIRNPKGLHHAEHESGGVDALATLDGSIILTGTIPDARHSANVPLLNAANIFTANQRISRGAPGVYFNDSSQAADARLFRILNASQSLFVQAVNDADVTATGTFSFTRLGDFKAGGAFYEYSRAAPMGNWIDVPYSAANFTGNAAAWTVEAADIQVFAYTLIGKTMRVSFWFSATSVAAVTAYLLITLPFGVTPTRHSIVPMGAADNAVGVPAYVRAIAGDNRLYCSKSDGSGWVASVNSTTAYGQIDVFF